MSCPDWKALGPRGAEDSPAWRAALEHFDGCARCRDAALTAEPTLLFRRLPKVDVGAAEIEAMKSAVRSLRRAETLEHAPRRAPVRWLRAAAIAAVLIGAGLFLRDGGAAPDRQALSRSPASAVAEAALPAAGLALDFSHLPLVEDVDASLGSVIQLVDDDLAVVVIEMREKTDV